MGGQVIYTYMPLSPSSIIWYRLNGWGVNRHTTRCTSPVSVVSQCKLVSGWGLWKWRLAPPSASCGSERTLLLTDSLQIMWSKLIWTITAVKILLFCASFFRNYKCIYSKYGAKECRTVWQNDRGGQCSVTRDVEQTMTDMSRTWVNLLTQELSA